MWGGVMRRMVMVAAVLALAACGGDDITLDESVTTTAPTADGSTPTGETTVPAVASTVERTTTTEESATTTTASTAAAAKKGTRENPFAPTDPLVTTEGMQIQLGAITIDGAEIVAAGNQFNDPAPDGTQYVVVVVTFTNGTKEPATPGFGFNLKALGSGNTVHDECGASFRDNGLFDVPELYPGGSGSGLACVLVPTAEVADGSLLLLVSYGFSGDDVFVRPA